MAKVLKESDMFCTCFCVKETGLKVIKKIIGFVDIFTAKSICNESTKEKKAESFAGLRVKSRYDKKGSLPQNGGRFLDFVTLHKQIKACVANCQEDLGCASLLCNVNATGFLRQIKSEYADL